MRRVPYVSVQSSRALLSRLITLTLVTVTMFTPGVQICLPMPFSAAIVGLVSAFFYLTRKIRSNKLRCHRTVPIIVITALAYAKAWIGC